MYILLIMSVTYSTDPEIKTVVKRWYDVNVSVDRWFAGLFSLGTARNGRESESLDEVR